MRGNPVYVAPHVDLEAEDYDLIVQALNYLYIPEEAPERQRMDQLRHYFALLGHLAKTGDRA